MSDEIKKKTLDKPPENMVPCETAVEISNRRRAGVGGSKATQYNCNFAKNDYERNKAKRKRFWREFWQAYRGNFFLVYIFALITLPYLFAGSKYSPTWKTISIIAIIFFGVVLFVIFPVKFFLDNKRRKRK